MDEVREIGLTHNLSGYYLCHNCAKRVLAVFKLDGYEICLGCARKENLVEENMGTPMIFLKERRG